MNTRMHLRRIRRISSVCARLTTAGCLSRRGMIKRALSMPRGTPPPNIYLHLPTLIDFNERKAAKAVDVWGRVNFVNPYSTTPGVLERLALLVSSTMPTYLGRALQVYALSLNLRRREDELGKVVLWNPYSPFHHAVASCFRVSDCYILAPFYPLVKDSQVYTGFWPIRDIYRLDGAKFRELAVEDGSLEGDLFFSLHLSKLSASKIESERALIKLATFLHGLGARLKLYLHPVDRTRDAWPELPAKLQTSVVRHPYVGPVGGGQISITGISTVGVELHARGSFHFFISDADDSQMPLARWAKGIGRLLDPKLSGEEMLRRIEYAASADRHDLGPELAKLRDNSDLCVDQ